MSLISKRRNFRRQNRKYTRGRNKRKSFRKMKGGGDAQDIELINYLKNTTPVSWDVETIRTHVNNGASIAATFNVGGYQMPVYKYMAILNAGTDEHNAIYEYITTLPGYKPSIY